jgi:hypothetical protein
LIGRHIAAERLSAFGAGDLPARDADVVQAHLDGCRDCAAAAAELAAVAAATRTLDRPEPPPTLWPAIEGALAASSERRWWSWRPLFVGALAGGAAVALGAWGFARVHRGAEQLAAGVAARSAPARASSPPSPGGAAGTPEEQDPLLAEAESELERAAAAYEQAVRRLRGILAREQRRWDPEARARLSERLARLDEAVTQSRAAVRRDPSDGAGAEMLFAAYRRQIDFLTEAVHRGAPGPGQEGRSWP